MYPGDRVEPDTVLGVETLPGEAILLDVAGALRLPPAEVAATLVVGLGERVVQGGVVARAQDDRGVREYRAPATGVLTAYDPLSGLATILPDAEREELRAQVPGVVREIVPGRIVRIEPAGALVSGVWGAGGEAAGVVRRATQGPTDDAQLEELDHRYAYSILVAGRIGAAALARCAELEVRAVVAGSIEPVEMGRYLGNSDGSLPLPSSLGRLESGRKNAPPTPVIMLLEGFGSRDISQEAWDILSVCDGRVGAVQAPGWPRRPRLVVQLPGLYTSKSVPPQQAQLGPGATAQVISGPHAGISGTVIRRGSYHVALPSGARAEAVIIRDAQGGELMVPILNLQVFRNAT